MRMQRGKVWSRFEIVEIEARFVVGVCDSKVEDTVFIKFKAGRMLSTGIEEIEGQKSLLDINSIRRKLECSCLSFFVCE